MATKEFNMPLLLQLMTKVTETWDQGKTEISTFTNMYYEFIKMFKHFGSAIGIAFKDINDKANTMVGN